MKILQVLPTLNTGGAEHCAVELANEFVRQGYECDVVTLFDIEKQNDLLKQLDSRINHFSLNKRKGFDICCYFKLYHFIKKGKYNVVHAHVGAIPYLLLASLLLKKVKFVATIHSEAKRDAGKSICKWTRIFMFKNGLCIPVTISEESKASFDEYYKMDAPMVYNGMSDYESNANLGLRDNKKQLLFIHPASCQMVKNQQLLFRAFSKLTEEHYNVKLCWLGSVNTYYELYESLKKEMPSSAIYIGVVSNVRDYLAEADAMCLSSKMEGMPMTIIEAFSVGCPCLCTPVGGIVNMIRNGENGMLSENLEIESYYKMLKTFCELTTDERQTMRDNAKQSFANFSVEKSAKGYLEIYRL